MSYINEDYEVGIKRLYPSGTNSIMFTECCGSAICDNESKCPSCGRKVIGWDAETSHKCGLIRWRDATKYWNRSK